jgi:hypothetical protein
MYAVPVTVLMVELPKKKKQKAKLRHLMVGLPKKNKKLNLDI